MHCSFVVYWALFLLLLLWFLVVVDVVTVVVLLHCCVVDLSGSVYLVLVEVFHLLALEFYAG